MSQDTAEKVAKIYDFVGRLYPANWITRWGETPFMQNFTQQSEITKFVNTIGKFESVPGHVWACCLFWMQLRKICPELDKVVNSNILYEELLIHDIGETYTYDTPLSIKINGSMSMGKVEERKGFCELIKPLAYEEQNRLVQWFDDFENEENENTTVETLIARLIDNLQGDHFGLVFGSDLSKHSELIEKIVKKRSIGRARNLINHLVKLNKIEASKEVEDITKAHILLIKKSGINLNLKELGF